MNMSGKRLFSLLLAIIMVFSMMPPNIVFAEDEIPGDHDHTDHLISDSTKPVCTGLVDCAAEAHAEDCAKKLAEEKAAADQAAADTVAALIAALPALEDVKTKSKADMQADFEQVNAAMAAYEALTADQKALLPPAEDVFKPYFDFFATLTEEAADPTGSCGTGVTWTYNATTRTLTISGSGAMDGYQGGTPGYASKKANIQKIVIEDGVTAIGSEAFENCTAVTTVEIAASVKKIGFGAFNGCSALSSINLPSGLTEIAGYLFTGCSSLKSINIPSGVTNIGSNAFQLSGLTNIVLPEGLTSIQASAFNQCTSLYSITIPTTLSYIGTDAFHYCGIKSVYLNDLAAWCASEHGSNGTTPFVNGAALYVNNSKVTNLVIPDGIVSIGSCAFYNCNSITSVTIPASVKSLGNWAFYNATGVKTITFEGDAPSFGNIVFTNITATAYYPRTASGWTSSALGNHGTGTITWKAYCPDGVHAYDKTVASSTYLASAATCTAKAKYYYSCACGEKGTETFETGSTASHSYTLETTNYLKSVATCKEKATYYKSCAYCGAKGTATFTVGELGDHNYVSGVCSVCGATETLGGKCGTNATWTFDSSTGTLTISGSGPMEDYIGENDAPWNDISDQITSIIIKDSITHVGDNAFPWCTYLTSVTLPNSVTSIGDTAFAASGHYESISMTIPASVTSIGEKAFYFSGVKLTFLGNAPEFGADVFADSVGTVFYPKTGTGWTEDLKQSVGTKNITWKFYDPCAGGHNFVSGVCSVCGAAEGISGKCGENLTWTLDSNGLLTISGTGPMYNYESAPFADYSDQIKTIVVKEGVTNLSFRAFYMSAVTSVSLPSTLDSIGGWAFGYCKGLTSIYLPEGLETIDGSAFHGCDELTSLIIPSTVTTLGSPLAESSEKLTTITFTGNMPAIGENSFRTGSSSLTVYYPGTDNTWETSKMKNYGFSGTIQWVPVLEDLGSGKCGENLTWTLSADGVLTISGTGPMADYTSNHDVPWADYQEDIVSVKIKSGATSIGSFAFFKCSNLVSVEIPDKVTSIGECALSTCASLRAVVIPASVTNIAESAFSQCGELWHILHKGTQAQWNNITIGQNNAPLNNATIHHDWTGSEEIDIANKDCSICIPTIRIDMKMLSATGWGNNAIWIYVDNVLTHEVSLASGSTGSWSTEYDESKSYRFVWRSGSGHDNCYFKIFLDNEQLFEGTHNYCTNTYDRTVIITLCSHSWQAATCTTVKTCSKCGLTEGSALGHTYGDDWKCIRCPQMTPITVKINSSGFTADSSIQVYVNGQLDETGFKSYGNYRKWETIYEPGTWYAFYWVKGANAKYHDVTISAANGTVFSASQSTCGSFADGELIYTICMHDWQDATCEAPKTCSKCGTTEGTAKTHTFDQAKQEGCLATPATCKAQATYYYSCICGEKGTETFSAGELGGHSYTNHVCTLCGAAETIGGKCGENVEWTLDTATGVLTVSGTGAMADYSFVTYQPWYAHRESITSVVVESGVTTVGNYAFCDTPNLTSITIPSSVTRLRHAAFSICENLTTISLAEGLQIIDTYAFMASGAATITIPSTVTEIAGYAFAESAELQSISISKNVTKLASSAFERCGKLTAITVAADNANYSSDSYGVLFNKDKTTLIQIPGGLSGSYTVPSTVKTIGMQAAVQHSKLTTITLQNGVETIEAQAFFRCPNLKIVELPATLTSVKTEAFKECSSLETVHYAGTETMWDAITFATGNEPLLNATISYSHASGSCGENLTWTLVDGVLTISGSGPMTDFSGRTAAPWYGLGDLIKSVVITDGVTSVGSYAFADDSYKMTSVTLADTIKTIGYCAFNGCTSLSSIKMSANLTTIDTFAFGSGLTSIEIPASVTSINTRAFYDCDTLTAINVASGNTKYFSQDGVLFLKTESVLIWYPAAKAGSAYTIPDGTRRINKDAFHAPKNLTTLTIPYGMSSIQERAFTDFTLSKVYYCGTELDWSWVSVGDDNDPLDNATMVYAISGYCGDPTKNEGKNVEWRLDNNGVLIISGSGAMADFESYKDVPWKNYAEDITAIVVKNGVTSVGKNAFTNYFSDCSYDSLTSVTLADSVKTIGNSAFDCSPITSIKMPAGLTEIGNSAFWNADLASIELPDNLQTIGASAFEGCPITSVTIPASVTSIGNSAFCCRKLTSITVASGNTAYTSQDGVLFSADKSTLIQYPAKKTDTSYVIPSTVKTINGSAFYYSQELTALIMPVSVERIGDYAFNYSAVQTVYYGGTSVDWSRISGNQALAHATIIYNASGSCGQNVNYSFFDGTLIISGTGPMADYTEGGAPWYSYRKDIKHIIVEDGVTHIGDYAFSSTDWLETATLGKDIKSIGDYAFKNCIQGTFSKIDLPSGLTTIGEGAFYSCTKITSLTIPSSVTSIGKKAFYYCSRLQTITFLGSCPGLVENGEYFYNTTGLTAYYPAGNTTWTEDVQLDYGSYSTVQWLGTCGDDHNYNHSRITYFWSSDYKTCTARKLCDVTGCEIWEASSAETARSTSEVISTATCDKPGKTVYTAIFTKHGTQTKEVTIPATGAHVYDQLNPIVKYLKDEATCTAKATYWKSCVCGLASTTEFFEDGKMLDHVYDQLNPIAKYLKDEATCTAKATYWKSCVCGLASATEFFEDGKTLDHVYDQLNPIAKYLKDEATCTAKATYWKSCVCGLASATEFFEDGKTLDHVYDQLNPIAKYLKDEATCTAKATYWKSCVCGLASATEFFEDGKTLDHVYDQLNPIAKYLKDEATCTAKATYWKSCVCGLASTTEFFEDGKTLDHVYDQLNPIAKYLKDEATCTAKATYWKSCVCGLASTTEFFEDGDTLGHDMGAWTEVTKPTATTDGQERSDCSRCDHFETRATKFQGIIVKLDNKDFANQKTVWINGISYSVTTDESQKIVKLPENAKVSDGSSLVTYTFHVGDAQDVHTQYPTGMKVWILKKQADGNYTATRVAELDNLLQYSGSSIRIVGKKGIRMITSISQSTKSALTGKGLAGYKLLEYGTALCRASALSGGQPMTLENGNVKSNYAYKKGVADPIFKNANGLVQYTNVLVGFTDDDCKEDIAMRPYIILQDSAGQKVTIYGGIIYRSIGYIAYQNRNAFKPGTEAYKYVWDIIHHVYGKKYDADFKG